MLRAAAEGGGGGVSGAYLGGWVGLRAQQGGELTLDFACWASSLGLKGKLFNLLVCLRVFEAGNTRSLTKE